jgi:hypothetical protein
MPLAYALCHHPLSPADTAVIPCSVPALADVLAIPVPYAPICLYFSCIFFSIFLYFLPIISIFFSIFFIAYFSQ